MVEPVVVACPAGARFGGQPPMLPVVASPNLLALGVSAVSEAAPAAEAVAADIAVIPARVAPHPPFPAGLDPVLDAMLEQEGRLRRQLASQGVELQQAEVRLKCARAPDPKIGEYMSSLGQHVLLEQNCRRAGSGAEAARVELAAAQAAFSCKQEEQRMQERRLANLQSRAADLSSENALAKHGILSMETRLGEARSSHAQMMAERRAVVEQAQLHARMVGSQVMPLELHAAQLEAEVQWCRALCGTTIAA